MKSFSQAASGSLIALSLLGGMAPQAAAQSCNAEPKIVDMTIRHLTPDQTQKSFLAKSEWVDMAPACGDKKAVWHLRLIFNSIDFEQRYETANFIGLEIPSGGMRCFNPFKIVAQQMGGDVIVALSLEQAQAIKRRDVNCIVLSSSGSRF